jgi:uncharacterized spore protein YtfJ
MDVAVAALALAAGCSGNVNRIRLLLDGGGAGGSGGTGSGVSPISQQAVDKVDMLFMVDNSISMADKQQILTSAVPQLVDRPTARR